MIKEAYCSFEVSKLLKEKGFDEACSFVVNTISKRVMPVSWPTTNSDIEDEKANLIALPTLQMTLTWLREVHGLHIYTFSLGGNWHYEIQVFKEEGYTYSKAVGNSHDETVEKAILYCLENLI